MANNEGTTLRAALALPQRKLFYKPKAKRKDRNLEKSNARELEKWPQVVECVRWADFKADTLNKSHFAGVLADKFSSVLEDEVDGVNELAPLPALGFANLAEIGSYLIQRCHKVLEPALQFAKNRLGLHPGAVLESDPQESDDNDSIMRSSEMNGAPLGMDHKVTLRGNSHQTVLVVGLGRSSTAFNANLVLGQGPRLTTDTFIKNESRLLGQLAHHCVQNKKLYGEKTRYMYGYIATDKSVTCCRFSKSTSSTPTVETGWESQGAKRMRVEIADIPYGIYGKNTRELTTDLAIWWLCMIALSEYKKNGTQTGAQETPEIPDQQVDMELDAPMSVSPPPFQVSGAGDVGNQQENEALRNQLEIDIGNLGSQNSNFEQADQMPMGSDSSNNWDALVQPGWYYLANTLANVAETPRNVFYTPPLMMGSYSDEMPNWRCESPAGQPQMDAQAATPGYDSTPITTESSPASSAY